MSWKNELRVKYSYKKVLFERVGEMNDLIGWLILLCAIVIIEFYDFRLVPALLGFQGVLFLFQFAHEGIGIEVLPLAIFSILFVPITLYYITVKTKIIEEKPLIPNLQSIGLLIVLIAIAYGVLYLLNIEDIQLLLILVGVYGLLIKTDLRKSAASLSILINAAHLFMESFNVIVDFALMTLSAILILLLLYFANQIYLIKGSLSTRDLKDLRF
ncbi:MAG: hypothetical protein ACFFCW_32555 [Candidatus Hodarchaeota archaeon]